MDVSARGDPPAHPIPQEQNMRRLRTRSTYGLVVVALAVLLAACDGTSDGGTVDTADTDAQAAPASASADALTVVATEFSYDPEDFTLPADTPVEIVLDNQGVIEHDITIDEGDVYIYADAGETVSEEVTLPAGTYTYYCDIPGHRASGMEGTVTVE
jgi:plastocyanin